ncbi:hypothetical protein F4810DRAFT_554792 [Camillea tinctor]|nr:hypothetical protein F4810DRAFT_554792 [Camillea tinctor]
MSAACVQRPRMGSSQPPDGNAPFGYNFPDQDFLFLRAPTPPPGDPLLTNDDSRLLNTFFEDMTSNQYQFSYGEGLNFSEQWISQLPPSFLGHTTSFGPQPPQNLATSTNGLLPSAPFPTMYNFGQTIVPPPPQPTIPHMQHHHPHHHQPHQPQHQPQHQHQHQQQQHTSPNISIDNSTVHADVAAVLTTLQNGHPSRTNSLNHGSMLTSQSINTPIDHTGSTHRANISPERNDHMRHAQSNEPDHLFTDMVFGAPRLGSQRHVEAPDLQWGSDATFAGAGGFVPPEHESTENLVRRRMSVMKAIGINRSATTTRAPTPSGNEEDFSNRRDSNVNGYIKEEVDLEAPAKKRRKSKAKEEVEIGGGDLPTIQPKAAARKRKSKPDLNGAPEASSSVQETPGKRRKSGLNAGPKLPRENLTDAQKRENHIKSEQKRRGAIKEGFEGLCEIVPNLKGGGYSKSTMLVIAGEWLEALIKGNEEISRGQLSRD